MEINSNTVKQNKVTIYSDPGAVYDHDPAIGNMECGQRVNINRMLYAKKGYCLAFPKIKTVYLKTVNQIHKDNPLWKLLKTEAEYTTTSNPNSNSNTNFNELDKINPSEEEQFPSRNCHGCTMNINDKNCPICETKYNSAYYFNYAFNFDKNIIDSDTTFVTTTTLKTVKNAVSLVCQMVDDLFNKRTDHGFAIVRPPGHHACCEKSAGFCLVNNIAISTEYAIQLGYQKVFIFDFDAHHGDGTQKIFYHRKDVFYCSMHTESAYPKTGLPEEMGEWPGYCCNLNILVPKDADDKIYLEIFRANVLMTISAFNPDLILVSAGFDGLATDPMGIMKLTVDCYGKIVDHLIKFGVPIGMVLEGGYNLEDLPKCYDICLNSLRSCH